MDILLIILKFGLLGVMGGGVVVIARELMQAARGKTLESSAPAVKTEEQAS